MGSFNASCAISNAPIRSGDEVVLFYVVNQDDIAFAQHHNTFRGINSQADCHFQLVGFPMQAKYNDCAIFKVQETLSSELTLDILKKHYTSTPMPKNDRFADPDYYDVPNEKLTHDMVQDFIREGLMYLDSTKDLAHRRFVSQIAIHKVVFDELLKFTKIRTFGDDPDSYTTFEFFNVQDFFEHEISEQRKNIKKEKIQFELNYNMFNSMIGNVSEDNGKVFTAEDAYNAATAFAKVSELREDRNPFSYNNYNSWLKLRTLYEERGRTQPFDEVFEELYMYKCICTAFYCACSEVQKPFLPTVTASQDDNLLTNAVLNINIGLSLLNKECKKSEYSIPFEVQKPMLETKLSDFQKFFNEHWSTDVHEKGLKAVEYVKRFRPVVELTPENISTLHLEVLMEALQCHDITLKIIIDL